MGLHTSRVLLYLNTWYTSASQGQKSLQYQLHGLTRYVRDKYEVNIVLDVCAPFRLYLVHRLNSDTVHEIMSTVHEIMSTVDTYGYYIYEKAPIEEFMKIATKPNPDILQAVSNRATEKTLDILG